VTTADGWFVGVDDLHRLAERVLVGSGMPAEHARWTADAMAWAESRGIPAHGVTGKLGQCVARIRDGGTAATPAIEVVGDLGAAVALDAGTAWGQVAGTLAVRTAIERAARLGVGLVSVRNASSAAALGYYAWLAAEDGMVGIAVTNGPPLIAAPEGRSAVVGNQGHAIACPGRDGNHLLHDSALTTMSTGAMEGYHQRGELLPEGVLRDASGAPTRDPAAWATGLLEPIGGHRGFGLAIALEGLTGLLSGGERFGARVGLPGVHAEPQGVSLLLVAIDPRLTGSTRDLTERVESLRSIVRESASPGATTRLPGERGHWTLARGDRVFVHRARLAELAIVAREAGVAPLATASRSAQTPTPGARPGPRR
jgi:LDH2 family malate/lactate/ureidoglycolate dehydrogenase